MKKSVKILSGVVAFTLIGVILWFANGFLGNPISKAIVNNSARKYIEENYPNMNLEVSEISYSFKDGNYNAYIKSNTSTDTYFSVTFSPLGKIGYDSYENDVANKYNTYTRINGLYDSKVRTVFEGKDFPYKSEINFGELREQILQDTNDKYGQFEPKYGLDVSELELDKNYNINELGKKYGHIVLYIQETDINIKRSSEILLDVKNILDNKNISFYAIDLTIEKPLEEEEKTNGDNNSINIQHFLYSDIYEKGLEKRIKKAYDNLQEYYKEQDKIKGEK